LRLAISLDPAANSIGRFGTDRGSHGFLLSGRWSRARSIVAQDR
jgi:hypothetical protein